MAQISLSCPHCKTEKAAFTVRGHVGVGKGVQNSLVFLQCGVCGHGVVGEGLTAALAGWANDQNVTTPILNVYPATQPQKAPANVPDTICDAYLAGIENLPKRANAAVAMFRRTIELTVRALDAEAPPRTPLIERIDRLSSDLITPAMKEWAHQIRMGGNDALHDPEDFSVSDAHNLRTFTELFLTYAFTLPAMLKKATEPQAQSKPA